MERLAARLSDKRVTALKPETDELRRRVVAAYEFKEDREQAGKVAWDADAAPRGVVGATLARLARLLGATLARLARLLEHRTSQLAAVAASVAALFLGIQWAVDARRVADLSSQLSGFAQSVSQLSSQVNEAAQFLQDSSKPNARPTIRDSDFTQIYARLKAIEGGLNTLKTTARVLPQPVQPTPQLQPNQ
jgi:hypothetical protein